MIELLGAVKISTANTDPSGATPAGMLEVCIGPCQIKNLTAKAQGTTTAGLVHWFIQDYKGATHPVHQMVVAAITVGASTAAWVGSDDFTALGLGQGCRLLAAPYQAEAFSAMAFGER